MRFLGLLLLSFGLLSCQRSGNAWQSYRAVAVKQAIDRNMVIYLHFDQDGVPACDEQREILKKVILEPKFKGTGAYRVKWGSDPKLQDAFGLSSPCALIACIGSRQIAGAVGKTDEASLRRTLEAAIAR